jgi:hypothetical protein
MTVLIEVFVAETPLVRVARKWYSASFPSQKWEPTANDPVKNRARGGCGFRSTDGAVNVDPRTNF